MKHLNLQTYLDHYTQLRKALGFKVRSEERYLRQFVGFLESQESAGPIHAEMAVQWALSTSRHSMQARRLTLARRFLLYLKAFLPDTAIPSVGLLAGEPRPRPYVYSEEEIVRMQRATRRLWDRGCLPQITFETLIGLLACTGLRIGEALRLTLRDVQLNTDPPRLEIRNTKFGKSRFVPVHPSTAQRLRRYLDQRHRFARGETAEFFLFRAGQPLRYPVTLYYFRQIAGAIGVPKNKSCCGPALHSLRHAFAVRRLLAWYRSGLDVRALLPNLAVYMGHLSLVETYRYLSATPELLSAAAVMFASYAEPGGDQ